MPWDFTWLSVIGLEMIGLEKISHFRQGPYLAVVAVPSQRTLVILWRFSAHATGISRQ